MEVRFFDESLQEFITGLQKPTISKVLRAIELIEKFGYHLGMPHSKKIDVRLFELRVRGQQEVRIFYTFHKDLVFLIHGFIKKSQKIPERELATAHHKLQALDRL